LQAEILLHSVGFGVCGHVPALNSIPPIVAGVGGEMQKFF